MKDRIKQVIANSFNVPLAEIPDNAEINNVPGWDSLGHMILMLELESEFKVSIPTDEMTRLLSLELIQAFLQDHDGPGEQGDSAGALEA